MLHRLPITFRAFFLNSLEILPEALPSYLSATFDALIVSAVSWLLWAVSKTYTMCTRGATTCNIKVGCLECYQHPLYP